MEAMMPSGGYARVLTDRSVGIAVPKHPVIGEYIGAVVASVICRVGGLGVKPSILVYAFLIILFEEVFKKILSRKTQENEEKFLQRLNSIKFLTYQSVGGCDVLALQERLGKKYEVDKNAAQAGMLSIRYKNDEYVVYDNSDESFSIKRVSMVNKAIWDIENAYGNIAFHLQEMGNHGKSVNIVAENNCENKPTVKDHIILIIKLLLIVTSVVIIFSGNKDNRYIEMVKGGTLPKFSDRPIGETLEAISVSTKWEYFEKRDEKYVRFSGRSAIFGKEMGKVKIQIDFLLFDEDGTFQIDEIKVDGEKLDEWDEAVVLYAIFGDDEDD